MDQCNGETQVLECVQEGNLAPSIGTKYEFGFGTMNYDISSPFPSLETKNRRNFVKRQRRDKTAPIHQLATNSSILAQSLPKNRGGRPKKLLVSDETEPKRSVGRPRIHPIKEVDPNRPKRVAKGDKPLGRPRTSHLKPPVAKRARGRPRKDAESEGIRPFSPDTSAELPVSEKIPEYSHDEFTSVKVESNRTLRNLFS